MRVLLFTAASCFLLCQQALAGTTTMPPPTSVPEASAIGMLALGVAAVAAIRYFKK